MNDPAMRYVNDMDQLTTDAPTAPEAPATNIVVLAAHPNWRESRVNLRLSEAARELGELPGQGHPVIDVRDLYAHYPDYDIDVAAEQQAVAGASLIVLLHPVQWYSMPALLKLWLDEVLTYGWAYGPGGQALQGKDLWLVATTGGPESSYHPQSYNRYFFDAFLPPYEQTAALCGMRFLPPLLLHGARSASEESVKQHVDIFSERLRSYPDWPEMDEIESCPACAVPTTDRPHRTPD